MTVSLMQSHHDYTFGDYLVLECDSEVKHEFDAGEILARSGGTARHSALAAKIVTAMEVTRSPGCTVFTSDMRARVVATGRATYPDVSMVCGPIEYDPEDAARTTITNPALLVEVLSVKTEKGDRGNKWMHYQRISALQEYVLASHEARVEIFRRRPRVRGSTSKSEKGPFDWPPGPRSISRVLYADLPI